MEQRQAFFPANAVESRKAKKGKQQLSKAADYSQFFDFQKDTLQIDLMERENGGLYLFGEQLYLLPKDMPSLHTLKVLRCGLHLGTLKKNRFEPSHALALALKPQEVQHVEAVCNRCTDGGVSQWSDIDL